MLRSIKQAVLSVRMARAAAGLALLGGVGAVAIAGLAAARPFTLRIDRAAAVGVAHESIAVDAKGFAVYELSPETTHHVLCKKSNQCLSFWPPVTVASAASKPSVEPGIKGKLGVWHRDGFFQVTLGGHPLYTFVEDKSKGVAKGNGIKGFGGTWHVVRAASATQTPNMPAGTPTTAAPMPSTPAMMGTTPNTPYSSSW